MFFLFYSLTSIAFPLVFLFLSLLIMNSTVLFYTEIIYVRLYSFISDYAIKNRQ